MTDATTTLAGGAERTVQPVAAGTGGRRLRLRHLWLVPGLAIAIGANQLGNANGVGILALIAFGIAPDVPRLFGRRAVAAHNLLHQPLTPVVALAVATLGVYLGIAPMFWLVGSLVWMGHILAGRAVGDTPRQPQDPTRA